MFLSTNILIILASNTFAQHWTYDEQNNWSQEFSSCGGERQSPININTNEVRINPWLDLNLVHYDRGLTNAIASNNLHTVRISLNDSIEKPHITGSAVNGRYDFAEFHFHWGDNDFDGTEHTVNHIKGSSELHIVHYNHKYGTLLRARDHSDGIVVLTVFLEVTNYDNIALQPIIDVLPEIVNYNSSTVIREELSLDKILPFNTNLFYRYKGSLTAPPCSESVTWLLLLYPIKISHFQLSQFRQLFEQPIDGPQKRIISNTRIKQPINGRIVECSTINWKRFRFKNSLI